MRSALVLVGLLGCGGSADAPNPTDTHTHTDTDTEMPSAPHWALSDSFLGIAHRGGALLAPENTLEAIEAAKALGANVMEIDLFRTADGHLVLLHDKTVDRTTDGTGNIQDLTLEEVKALDAGYDFTLDGGETYPFRGQGVKIPTFEEALALGPDLYWDVEVKQTDPPIFDDVIAAIEAAGMKDRVFIACFDDAAVKSFREAYPDYVTNFGDEEYALLAALPPEQEADYVPPGDIAQVPSWYLTADFVDKAHRLGVKVHVWTINGEQGMIDAIDLGVDGVITDAPDILLELMAERGLVGPE